MTTTLSHVRLRRCGPPRGSRPGFSLTELLVVIAILGILSSLILAGLNGARARLRADKTATTIRKLHEVLLSCYEEYEVRRPNLPQASNLSSAQYQELHRIAIRRLMCLEMPDQASDIPPANQPPGGTPYPTLGPGMMLRELPPVARRFRSIIDGARVAQPSSAELLYMIVMRGPASDPDIVAHFRPDEIGDVDGNGLPEFIDAWRRPIMFRRWPVGVDSPLQPTTNVTPDLLVSTSGYPLMPLIVSAGPNETHELLGVSGLQPQPDPASGNLFDPFRSGSPAPRALSSLVGDDITNHDLLR